MTALDLNLNIELKEDCKLLAISDIHEHSEQFFEIWNKFPPSENLKWVVCGDLIDKGFGTKAFETIASSIKDACESGLAYAVPGNHELKKIKKLKRDNLEISSTLKWFSTLPLAISFIYPNQKRYTVVHAGIDSKVTWEKISSDLNVCYVRYVAKDNGKSVSIERVQEKDKVIYKPSKDGAILWHEKYDGRFGYVISGHNNDPKGPNFYNYSCNIDTGVFTSGKLTSVIFNSSGTESVYQAQGRAFGWRE